MALWRWIGIGFWLLCAAAMPAQAAISFSLRTGNDSTKTQSMALDSNQCPAKGPTAAFVGGTITNNGSSAVTDITAALNGLGNGFYLAGGQGESQFIGTLAAGETASVYWFVGYGCTDGALATPQVNLSSSLGSQSVGLTLRGRAAISANAGGNVLNATLGAGAVVGQTIHFDANYGFGGSDAGDEFILQPSGGQNFNAACFRLTGARITSSNIAPISTGTTNRLYFVQTAKQSGNGYTVGVRYYFQYLCDGSTTTARPYAIQTSGASNIKYTGNFDGTGSIALSFPGATNPFTITKTASDDLFDSARSHSVTYTITIANPSAYPTMISSITDTLPAGVSFIGLSADSDVTALNSSATPSAGAMGTLNFIGKRDQSYVLPAGGVIRLVYTATIPAMAGNYTNAAYASFGSATTATASVTVTVHDPVALGVTKISAPYSDPVNGTSNPKTIPGSVVGYTIAVQNPGVLPITADSVIVTDPTPAGLRLIVSDIGGSGSGPVAFADGNPSSALSFSYAGLVSTSDDLEFSNDGGASWTYIPSPGADGSDAAVSHVRIRPKGVMAGNSAFQLRFRYAVN